MKQVFYGSYEFIETELPDRGGFVYAFALASSGEELNARVQESFDRWGFRINNIEFSERYDKQLHWETPAQTRHFRKLYRRAYDELLVFDTFYRYKAGDE